MPKPLELPTTAVVLDQEIHALKNNYTTVASDIEMDKASIKEFGQARETEIFLLEEEASFDDVDLHEAIEDNTPVEVRGTCCGSCRLQINLTLVQGTGLASSYFLTFWI